MLQPIDAHPPRCLFPEKEEKNEEKLLFCCGKIPQVGVCCWLTILI
jgi:hypothetical protein